MDIDVKTLRCFAMLANELNFSRAADRMALTQPALSSQIRSLESRFGCQLFARTTRRVSLTDQGRALLPAAQKIIDENLNLQRVVDALLGNAHRKLRFGAAFYTIDIPERVRLVERFFSLHPDIALDVITAWQRDMVRNLQTDDLDLALVVGMAVSRATLAREVASEAGVEILYPEDVPRVVLRREAIELLVPRESSLATLQIVPRAALAGLRVAMIGPSHGRPLTNPIRQLFKSSGAELQVPSEQHGIGVERYARQFRIVAISLGWFGSGRARDDMVRVPVEGLSLQTDLVILRAPGNVTGSAAIFWEHAQDMAGTMTTSEKMS